MEGFPDDATGEALRSLWAYGDNLVDERPVYFSVLFTSRDSALKFAMHFLCLNYTCKLLDNDACFEVFLSRTMLPSYDGITALERELKDVAKPLEGRNNGWWSDPVHAPLRNQGLGRRLRRALRVFMGAEG
jgi:hypothetical protein